MTKSNHAFATKRFSSFLFLLIALSKMSNGQEYAGNPIEADMKKEIAVFSIAPAFPKNDTANGLMPKLFQIPLKRCSDSLISFYGKDRYTGGHAIAIRINRRGSAPSIDYIFYMHYKYGHMLPDSAVANLPNPHFCVEYSVKSKPGVSNNKVFRSEDNRRVYTYMLNGQGAGRYEAILIIKDGKYYARVINPVPEKG